MARLKINLSEVQDFVPIEPGRYIAKLKKCENKPSKNSGNPTLYMKWTIMNGSAKGSNINGWASLQPQALSTFKQIELAYGAKGKGSEVFDTDAWLNRNLEIIVALREAQDGTKRMLPSIIAYLPLRGEANDADCEGAAAVEEVEDVEEVVAQAPKKAAAKVESKLEKARRELAELEAAETTEGDGEAVEVAPARPKTKSISDLKAKLKQPAGPTVEVETEEDPF